jgi:hypothetical protein
MSKSEITILLQAGTPEGWLDVEKSDWTGRGMAFSRSEYAENAAIRGERRLRSVSGVYILCGTDEVTDQPQIYVGESGENIAGRLDAHARPADKGGKDFWDRAIVFTCSRKSFGKDETVYVERELIKIAARAQRCIVSNVNEVPKAEIASNANIQGPTKAKENISGQNFLVGVLDILPFLNVGLFQLPPAPTESQDVLKLEGPNAKAAGYQSSGGVVVTAGSLARRDTVTSIPDGVEALRKQLTKDAVVEIDGDHLLFRSDYLFKSLSTAASVVLGRSANGRTEWKDASGRTVAEIESEATEQGAQEA